MISEQDIQSLAELARIAVPDSAVAGLKTDLEKILEYVAQLEEVDTTKIQDDSVSLVENTMRRDTDEIGTDSLDGEGEALVQQAHEHESNYVVVKKIL